MNFSDYKQLHFSNKNCDVNYWYRQGTGSEFVFLLHGAGCDHLMFEKQLCAFDSAYSIIAWDARGHGASKLAHFQKFVFSDMIDDVLKLFEIHNIKNAVFIGQSMGGNLSQEIAYRYPEKVQKLVLIDCTSNTQKLTIIEKLMLKLSRFIFNCYPWKNLVNQCTEACGITEYTKNYVRYCFENLTKESFVEILMSMVVCLHEDTKFRFRQPVLWLCGEFDKLGNIKNAKKWAAADKNITLRTIKNASHNANQDNPEEVNRHILSFLS